MNKSDIIDKLYIALAAGNMFHRQECNLHLFTTGERCND